MKIFFWLLFIIFLIILGWQGIVITNATGAHYSLLQLEFADKIHGQIILKSWEASIYGGKPVLELVASNFHFDFFFLISYTALLTSYSNSQMQSEPNLQLNTLLRLNLFLSILAGLFDITENVVSLYNIRHITDPGLYITTNLISSIKWILIVWVLFVWFMSILHTRFSRN